jgi:hypothetical protein
MENNFFKDFEVFIASDVSERNGIGIEIYKEGKILIEIFRDDTDKNLTVSCFEINLPLEFVEKAIELFREKIPQEFIDYDKLDLT